MSGIRVLIVDDAREWREFISRLLAKDERFEIIEHAKDGSEAIQLATQTKPRLILLDIEMPRLNGLQAAKKLRVIEPDACIIFVSGETDQEVVTAALDTGALGYVAKINVSRDLLPAIDEALDGKSFVSPGLLSVSAREENPNLRDSDMRQSNTLQKGFLTFSFASNRN